MNAEQNIKLIHRVLSAAWNNEECVQFHPRDDGSVVPWVVCNDVFAWACADAEDITLENIALFEQTVKDVVSIIPVVLRPEDIATLFACRVRQQRPFKSQGTYGIHEALVPLIEQLPEAPVRAGQSKE